MTRNDYALYDDEMGVILKLKIDWINKKIIESKFEDFKPKKEWEEADGHLHGR